jgi:hypothetical protein
MRWLGYPLLYGWIALILVAAQAAAKPRLDVSPGLDDAWRQYLAENAAREPRLEFPYASCFRRAAAAHGLPVTLLLAIARGESDFNARAVSHANALGLMQILWPGTARHLGIQRRADLFQPCTNVDAGARYLKELLARYAGNLHRTLAAYNYGPARVPVVGADIPRGAQWYSGYIYRHLSYVLGSGAADTSAPRKQDYRKERKLLLIAFGTPYRAAAFVENLQQTAPGVRLDWFREDATTFKVVMLYSGEDDLAHGKRLLHRAGFAAR